MAVLDESQAAGSYRYPCAPACHGRRYRSHPMRVLDGRVRNRACKRRGIPPIRNGCAANEVIFMYSKLTQEQKDQLLLEYRRARNSSSLTSPFPSLLESLLRTKYVAKYNL